MGTMRGSVALFEEVRRGEARVTDDFKVRVGLHH